MSSPLPLDLASPQRDALLKTPILNLTPSSLPKVLERQQQVEENGEEKSEIQEKDLVGESVEKGSMEESPGEERDIEVEVFRSDFKEALLEEFKKRKEK